MPWGSRGGYPARSSQGGYPARSSRGGYPARGGTLPGGVPWLGGYPGGGGTLAGGYPGWGGTQLGQHREYLLHGGRYASCIHAGGLSCSDCDSYSSYRNKWVVQNFMDVFTLCDCDNVTRSYTVHYKQKLIALANRTA